jgi:hypothetical protein
MNRFAFAKHKSVYFLLNTRKYPDLPKNVIFAYKMNRNCVPVALSSARCLKARK